MADGSTGRTGKKSWSSDATIGSVAPVPDPERNLPPWERANPAYGVGAGKDEKTSHSLSMRLTTKEYRELQKIVQHRKFPVIETQTDVMRIGLMMVRYWYGIHHGDPQILKDLDVEMWENERAARQRFRERVLGLLEGIEMEMTEARRLGYENRLKTLCAELKKYREQLTDEELRGKADLLYVQFHSKSK